MEIATIGFTKSSARSFFERLTSAGIPTLVDVRRNNVSQLAGFAKRDDLAFFLERLCGVAYHPEPLLAPETEDLKRYRSGELPWKEYEDRYCDLLRARCVEHELDMDLFDRGVVLLCSEAAADRCHRRLAAEYLAERWENVRVTHI